MLWRRSDRVLAAGPDVTEVVETQPDPAEVQAAYERGRRDERAGRKRHPLGMTLMFLAAAVGVFALVLAISNGSFQNGGATMDRGLETAADRATPVVRDAVANAGQAVESTGQNMKAEATDPSK